MMLKVTPEDLKYAMGEAGAVNTLPFGDRPWEAHLISQGGPMRTMSLGRYLLDLLVERAKTDIAGARVVRTLLTVLFAPPYRALKFALPDLALDRLAPVYSAYPKHPDSEGKSTLQIDVDVAMHEVSADWQTLFEKAISKVPASDDRYFLYCCAKLVVVNVCSDDRRWGRELARRMTEDIVEKKIKKVIESGEKEDRLVIPVKDTGVTFDDVAGCHASKGRMMDLAALLNSPDAAARWGVDLPRGILLAGPPGTGKTLMVRALATSVRRPLLAVKASQIFSFWYGQSHGNLAKVFQDARKEKGAILFFDEADGFIVNRRGGESHEESRRLVTEFNVQMEAIQPEDQLLVVLATNIKEALDEAAVRDQRFDEVIHVANPTLAERIEVLDLYINAAVKKAKLPPFSGPLDLPRLAAMTAGLSCAALAGIIQRVLRKKCHAQTQGAEVGPAIQDDLESAVMERSGERKVDRKPIGFASSPSVNEPGISSDIDLSHLLEPLD